MTAYPEDKDVSSPSGFRPNMRLLRAFKRWIELPRFDPKFATKWGRLCCNDLEAAMCEATYWDILAGFGVDVQPNDLGGVSAPDYLCYKGGVKFYVEVTCISTQTATLTTNLEPFSPGDSGARHYGTLNTAIANECREKTRQCANLDAPCLLAIGTFHFEASAILINRDCMGMLLTDEPKFAWTFDPAVGHCVGEPYLQTDFRTAAFTRLSDGGPSQIRQPISGLLIGGFGVGKPPLLGVLHPDARRPFDWTLLDKVPFCQQRMDESNATVSVEWLGPPPTE